MDLPKRKAEYQIDADEVCALNAISDIENGSDHWKSADSNELANRRYIFLRSRARRLFNVCISIGSFRALVSYILITRTTF